MNQIVQSRALVPENMQDFFRLAEAMAGAKLVPAHLQGKPADCLLVIEQAARWNLSPFAVAQETSVIQGKLMYSGKLTAAVVNALGGLSKRLSFEYRGQYAEREVMVSGTMQGEDVPRTVAVKLADAKTQNRVWQTQPDQQLAYFGARAWARRHTPELMLGVWSPEEFDDAPAPRQARQSKQERADPPRLVASEGPGGTPVYDLETGEVHEPEPSAAPVADMTGPAEEAAASQNNPPPDPGAPPQAESAAAPQYDQRHPGIGGGPHEPVPEMDSKSRFMLELRRTIDNGEYKKLCSWWNSKAEVAKRNDFGLTADELQAFKDLIIAKRPQSQG